jgi:hypothetical protein
MDSVDLILLRLEIGTLRLDRRGSVADPKMADPKRTGNATIKTLVISFQLAQTSQLQTSH